MKTELTMEGRRHGKLTGIYNEPDTITGHPIGDVLLWMASFVGMIISFAIVFV